MRKEECYGCDLNKTYGLLRDSSRPCSVCGFDFCCASGKISYKIALGEAVEYDTVCPTCMEKLQQLLVELECHKKMWAGCLANFEKESDK